MFSKQTSKRHTKLSLSGLHDAQRKFTGGVASGFSLLPDETVLQHICVFLFFTGSQKGEG